MLQIHHVHLCLMFKTQTCPVFVLTGLLKDQWIDLKRFPVGQEALRFDFVHPIP